MRLWMPRFCCFCHRAIARSFCCPECALSLRLKATPHFHGLILFEPSFVVERFYALLTYRWAEFLHASLAAIALVALYRHHHYPAIVSTRDKRLKGTVKQLNKQLTTPAEGHWIVSYRPIESDLPQLTLTR